MSESFDSNNLYVIALNQLRMKDVGIVGGKNASLGELISQLADASVRVPGGFATTAQAFREFLQHTSEQSSQQTLAKKIANRLQTLNVENVKELASAGHDIRQWILNAPFPAKLEQAIRAAYQALEQDVGHQLSFAVRSSATAEDLPDASFAGQQETFLNIAGIDNILVAIKEVFASLYNDRAISYRVHTGYTDIEVSISAAVQQMVRSDIGAAGVMFTLDTESGFDGVVFVTSSYGLGETVVQGAVNPDEFYVHKPMLAQGKSAIIKRTIGSKMIKMGFANHQAAGKSVQTIEVPIEEREQFSLTDSEVLELARYAVIIENHYARPMDIEWGKDGHDGKLYILQARPETVKSQKNSKDLQQRFRLKETGPVLITGRAIGQKIGSGKVRIIQNASEMDRVQTGDVLVADMTDPNWEPVMKKAAAIVTNRGGRTCHAAIIARELGVPAVVGCNNATQLLQEDSQVTVSCAEGDEGKVYEGLLATEITTVSQKPLMPLAVKIMMNVGNPELAFNFQSIPNAGVGLARLEFIINNNIGIHPKAILNYPNITPDLKMTVESLIHGYASPQDFYINKLTEGIATIAAAFWPKPVIVRLSDFKSNEYRKLIGGSEYEPEEENPMLGFRGAARYLADDFAKAFEMECVALKKVREVIGLTNVEIMVPFVRTLSQAKKVIELFAKHGLRRGENGLRFIMMCEVPSNAILATQFLEYFDGFSIGSNDLTQLTLGLDRDSGIELLAQDFDERDPALLALFTQVIQACHAQEKYVGICGQGPSDHPDFAQWLMEQKISSISLNPDTVINTWEKLSSLAK